MKTKLLLITVTVLLMCCSALKASLDSFVWAAERLSVFKDFDEARHDGLVCDLDEVVTASNDPTFAKIKYIRLKCDGASIEAYLNAFSKFAHLRVLVFLESKIGAGVPEKILLSAPKLRSLVFIKADVVRFDWPISNNSVAELWISSESVGEIPSSLMNDKRIETLIMSNCAIDVLRGDLSGMASLRKIYLNHCGIRSVDAGFGFPRSTEFVQLGFNELTIVPEFIAKSPGLKYVDLMSNKIDRIPAWFDDIMDGTALEVNLVSNNIRYVPDFIWNYGGRIHLADNEFSEDRHKLRNK